MQNGKWQGIGIENGRWRTEGEFILNEEEKADTFVSEPSDGSCTFKREREHNWIIASLANLQWTQKRARFLTEKLCRTLQHV